jgi:hypothetical protein
VFAVVIVFCCLFWHLFRFAKWKVDRMIKLDTEFEVRYENGSLKQKTHPRPAWDYSPCPGISKILHMRDWLTPLVMILFLVILVLYLTTGNALVAELLKYNFGAFLGTMAQSIAEKK